MTKIGCRYRIGSGPGAPGFSGGYGISAMVTVDTPEGGWTNLGNKSAIDGVGRA